MMKVFVKGADEKYRNNQTNFIQTKYEWLEGIAFHNYYKSFADCDGDERLWVTGMFHKLNRQGVLTDVKHY